jgi:hypothetical protein
MKPCLRVVAGAAGLLVVCLIAGATSAQKPGRKERVQRPRLDGRHQARPRQGRRLLRGAERQMAAEANAHDPEPLGATCVSRQIIETSPRIAIALPATALK